MKTFLLIVYLLGSTAAAVAAVVVAVRRAAAHGEEPPPPEVATLSAAGEAIAAEVLVFRTRAGVLALGPEARRERSAHPRTLRTFRFLRAYPGAPPRIPHGLSPEEFRTGTCGTCHQRGGYSIRFAAYAPVTPHPELGSCLGCHAIDDGVAGTASPAADPNSRCPQCHGPEGRVRSPPRATGWESLWFQPVNLPASGVPPLIPHDRLLREDCLACHSGPAAVAEIRTTHPERADCRSCHVATDPDAERIREDATSRIGVPQ
jgi:cytochrome c-type protein NapB